MIQNFGGGEILVIIIVALVVLGPDRLPEMARNAGKMLHKFRTMTSGLQSQVKDVMDDPAMQPLRELGEFAARPRQKLSEYAFEAEAEERAKAEQASLEAASAAAPSPEPAPLPEDDAAAPSGDGADPADDPVAQVDEPPVAEPAEPAEPAASAEPAANVPGAPVLEAVPPPATPVPAQEETTDPVGPSERESA